MNKIFDPAEGQASKNVKPDAEAEESAADQFQEGIMLEDVIICKAHAFARQLNSMVCHG